MPEPTHITPQPSQPSQGTSQPAVEQTTLTIGQTIVAALDSFVKLGADYLAKALGLWTAARSAISSVASGVAVAATRKVVQQAEAKYQAVQLSPVILADMAIRGVLPDPTSPGGQARLDNIEGHSLVDEAALSGISEDRIKAMILDTGESYGIIDALRLYNRGSLLPVLKPGPNYQSGTPLYEATGNQAEQYGITYDELLKVIHYSRTRDEFVPDFLKLARDTMSPADAIMLAVKQIVPTEVAQQLFEAAGGIGEQFQPLVDAAGDAAGVELAVHLAAHNVISLGQLRQIVGMSRLNPRFYYLTEPTDGKNAYTAPINKRWLSAYELREVAGTGLIPPDRVYETMLQEGYPVDEAKAFSLWATGNTVSAVKVETEAMILEEYQANMLTEEQATEALKNIGYHETSIPFLLKYAQAKAIISARNAAVTRIRQGYLLGLLNNDQATNELSAVGVPQAAISAYLADWQAELSVPHTALTTAQIGKLLKDGNISVDEARALWKLRGYTPTDIDLLLQLYPAPVTATPPSFTSPNSATVRVGQPADIAITATGNPSPMILETGALPAGLTWETPTAGIARIVGTPEPGTAGKVVLSLEAENGSPTPALQQFTLIVEQ